jgi:hypothetical protein
VGRARGRRLGDRPGAPAFAGEPISFGASTAPIGSELSIASGSWVAPEAVAI